MRKKARKKKKKNGWSIVVIILIVISAIMMLLGEIAISKDYFSSPTARWLRYIFGSSFTALLMGFVVVKLLKKAG